jgi:hypothetical protein
MSAAPGPKAGSCAPFVVGAPRSGTTLLRLMLDAHPQLAVPPETHFIPAALSAVDEGADAPEAFIRAVVGHPRWPDFGLPPDDLRDRVATIRPFEIGAALRSFYLLYAERLGKPRWGDKTPPYLRRMTEIEAALPEASFVHLIRDGRDVACSIDGRNWGPQRATAGSWWKRQILDARVQGARLTGYIELRYEDLVAEPETALRRVCDLIDLPWDPAMLDYHRGAEQRLTEIDRDLLDSAGAVLVPAGERQEMHRLARLPPQKNTSRWHREMTAEELARFEQEAGDLLGELGYELADASRSSA